MTQLEKTIEALHGVERIGTITKCHGIFYNGKETNPVLIEKDIMNSLREQDRKLFFGDTLKMTKPVVSFQEWKDNYERQLDKMLKSLIA